MKQFNILRCIPVCLLVTGLHAQSAGDTVHVQTFTYESTTRDTVISFPTYNSSEIERVWMRYAMRCKDGLVSPGISGQTNIGCGEWDYSCSTYITDSSRIDSLAATIDKYRVYPFPAADNSYSTVPTYSITQQQQQEVVLNAINSETSFLFNDGSSSSDDFLSTTPYGGKLYMLIPLSDLMAQGMNAGNIDALSLFNNGGSAVIEGMQISLKGVSFNDLAAVNPNDLTGTQVVFYTDQTVTTGENKLVFYQPFNWSGTESILIELSGKGLANNPVLDLQSKATTYVAALSAHDNTYGRFFEGNYVEVPGYTGISGNNPRTIEAWINTGVANKNIAAWGTDAQGKRFTFRLNSDGRLRVEINGGYVIGTTPVNDNDWHHVAAVLNGTNLSGITFYIDGEADPVGQINNLAVNTEPGADVEISRGFFNRNWNGSMDDVRIWSTALSQNAINQYRFRKVDSQHPDYANLELNLLFEEEGSATIQDHSVNGRHGTFMNYPTYGFTYGTDHDHEFSSANERLNLNLFSGDYTLSVTDVLINDTLPKESYLVLENTLTPNPGTLLSDISTAFYERWPDSTDLLDDQGMLIAQTVSPSLTTLVDEIISYYDRKPSKIELMSFVTPYGINLDLGMEGKAWYFDVTDYLPILQGNKRISIERGGQWQEDMDLQFEYHFGTPVREVLDLRQIWKVDSRPYTAIMNDTYFNPRTLTLVPGTAQAKIRSAISGHGQEGEFIPRTHFIDLNNGQTTYSWEVWKECAENPIYPQGGTWIYDRAGWCPGMPTDVKEWEVTDALTGGQLTVDYGVTNASGTSNYIVNQQIVSYGAPNFSVDARMAAILSPTEAVEHARYNPVCSQPRVVIENTGTTTITSASITYRMNAGTDQQFVWNGTLDFLEKVEIELPSGNGLWSASNPGGTNTFYAVVTAVNGTTDEYALNNALQTTFALSEVVPTDFIVRFKTNNAAHESAYTLKDVDGNVLYQRLSMTNNTTYSDTFALSTGCYILEVMDSGDDGISFWANSDGSGYLQLRSASGQVLKTFEPDFGGSIRYEFTVTDELGLEGLNLNRQLNVFPNPSHEYITLSATGFEHAEWQVIDSFGRVLSTGTTGSDHVWKRELNIADYTSGIYLVRLFSQKGSQTATFVKN